MGAEVFAAAAEERAEAEEVTRLEHIGGHVFALWGQVVEAHPSGLEQVNTIRGALEDGLVSTAVTHLQLSGDLFDLGVPICSNRLTRRMKPGLSFIPISPPVVGALRGCLSLPH